MTDESGQTYPKTIDTLLDRAVGAEGYYGAYTVNAHTDSVASSDVADAVVTSALARGVPIVSAEQMLTWLDGRNASIVRRDRVQRRHAELHGDEGCVGATACRPCCRCAPAARCCSG